MTEIKKLCIHCNIEKPLSELKKDKTMEHGRMRMCHDCYRLKYRKPKAEQEIIKNLPGEEWIYTTELGSGYMFSNYGRILSLNYNREGRTKILSIPKDKGYPRITFGYNSDGSVNNISVHRLVGKYFVPNPNNKPHINHIDGVKHNNYYKNLEWCTPRENMLHSFEIGLASNKGEKHSQAKITDADALNIKKLISQGLTNNQIQQQTSVPIKTISRIRTNTRWSHIKL